MNPEHALRHPPSQFPDILSDELWPNHAGDASPFPDSFEDMESSPSVSLNFIIPPSEADYCSSQSRDLFSPDTYPAVTEAGSRGGRAGLFMERQHPDLEYNALGLDIPSLNFHDPQPTFGIYNDQFSQSSPYISHRQPLQITTDGLSSPSTFLRMSGSHSPLEHPLSAGLSPYHASPAGISTPSTAGRNSMPLTPATLPSTSQPYLRIPANGGVYSPTSPYLSAEMHSPGSGQSKSPYSSSPNMSSPSISPVVTQHMLTAPSMPRTPGPNVLQVAERFPGSEYLVPQRVYRPNTQSDIRRYVQEVQLEEPIFFFMQHPDGLGISCKDAINSKFSRLVSRDDSMFQNRGPSVSIRINVSDIVAECFTTGR